MAEGEPYRWSQPPERGQPLSDDPTFRVWRTRYVVADRPPFSVGPSEDAGSAVERLRKHVYESQSEEPSSFEEQFAELEQSFGAHWGYISNHYPDWTDRLAHEEALIEKTVKDITLLLERVLVELYEKPSAGFIERVIDTLESHPVLHFVRRDPTIMEKLWQLKSAIQRIQRRGPDDGLALA